jgi:O-antigen/teichoic acid export membrane protein
LPVKGYIIGQKYWQGVMIVPTVLFSYIFLGIYTNLMAGIYIEKKSKYLPAISGLGALLNIIACFVLIPIAGIMGGAIATLVSYVSMAVYIYFTAQRFYPVKYEFSKVTAIIAVDVIAITVFYISYYSSFALSWYYRTGLIVVLCGIIIYLSELFKAKKLLSRTKITNKDTVPAEIPPEIINPQSDLN